MGAEPACGPNVRYLYGTENEKSEFEIIADKAVSDAEKVKCSTEAFVDGLETILDALQDRLACARDELRRQQKAMEEGGQEVTDY